MQTFDQIQDAILDRIYSNPAYNALEILTENEKASLSNLTSTSKVSVWRLFVYIISLAVLNIQQIFEIFKTEIQTIVNNGRHLTLPWYKKKALAFQYGDQLNERDEYDVIDVSKQIVKQVAFVGGDRKVTIKVATLVGDELMKITDINQQNAFAAYIFKIGDPGTDYEFIHEDADQLRVVLDYYYDPLLIKNDGTLIDNPTTSVVQQAIKNYLKSVEFDGKFDLNVMTDYIQRAIGYKSIKLNFVGFRAGIATAFTTITREYTTLSGHMKLAELEVNYIASV